MKRAFLLSFALHSFAILALMSPHMSCSGQSKSQENAERENTQGIDKKTEQYMQVEIIDPPKKGEKSEPNEKDGLMTAPHANQDCKDWFGGIGIGITLIKRDTGAYAPEVTEIHSGYPAATSGIKVGDVLMNNQSIRGEVGTTVNVIVERAGQTISFRIVRDKICTISEGTETKLQP